MSATGILRWSDEGLLAVEESEIDGPIIVADSWLTVDGSTLAVGMHRDRFLRSATPAAAEAEAAKLGPDGKAYPPHAPGLCDSCNDSGNGKPVDVSKTYGRFQYLGLRLRRKRIFKAKNRKTKLNLIFEKFLYPHFISIS